MFSEGGRTVKNIFLRLGMVLSGTALAVLLMVTPSKLSFAVTALLALGLTAALIFRTRLMETLFAPRPWYLWAAATVLCLSQLYTAKSTFFSCCYGWMSKAFGLLGLPVEPMLRLTPWVVALAALPMALGYFLWFVDLAVSLIRRFFQTSDFTERLFLLGAWCILTMVLVFTYLCTQAFYGAHINGSWFNFDLIYSADSGYLVHQDVFRNIAAEQNDLRQPLFGLFAAPFCQAAWLLSRVLFFLPNSYVTVSQSMQLLLYLMALVLLARMLDLKGAEKALFLVLMCVTYPVLIFTLTAEQYLFAVSWLLLLVYLQAEPVAQSTAYIAATGSLLTTGILFPLVTWDRDFKTFCKKTLGLCGAFFAVMILSGRLTTFLDIPSYIAGYGYYTGVDVPLSSKLMQYVNFAGACVLAPRSGVDFTTYRHVSWQMLPVTDWSVAGILVILAALGGILVSRKKRLTRICAAWLGFSFVLLGLVGWGTIDNGLMLYSLYFGWAFVAMIFELLRWAFSRLRTGKAVVLLALILGVGLYNVYGLRDVLVFATQFFPALGG